MKSRNWSFDENGAATSSMGISAPEGAFVEETCLRTVDWL